MAIEMDIGSSFIRNNECPPPPPPPHPLHDEPIITKKVYGSCRRQDCIEVIARAAKPVCIDGMHVKKGEIIPVPKGAGSVAVSNLAVKEIRVISKELAPFKKGFWNVQVRFIFEYMLTFFNCSKTCITRVEAESAHYKKFHLFGSHSSDFVVATDLFNGETFNNAAPFVWIDAKGVSLKAGFRCNHRDREPVDVVVTIGLFSVIKLFRLVCLNIQSRGFCVPRECDYIPIDPCEYFHSLEFPMDVFAPLIS